MKMKKMIVASLFALPLLYACSKSDSSSASLQQKWKIISQRVKMSVAGTTISDSTVQAATGSYMDFRSDGKVISYGGATGTTMQYDTSTYTLNGNNLTMISLTSGDTLRYQVQGLSNSGCTLYYNQTESVFGVNMTVEGWMNLGK